MARTLRAPRAVRSRGACLPPRSQGRRLRLTGRGRLVLLGALVLLLLGAFAAGRTASSQATETSASPVPLETVVVQSGDTLWSLAHRVAPARDPRDVVPQIRRLNHLRTAQLSVGQTLVLPAVA